ncbi:MAG: hypothetical protein U9P90_01095 [Patescibacteria group bacterium]|nr:hypothetical protein [Patescibacteria group bacterium]
MGAYYDNLKHTQSKVYHCLEKHPQTRNSDKNLYLAIVYEFYNDKLFKDPENGLSLPLERIHDLPTFESVRRMRQKIQSNKDGKGKFPPTSEAIRQKRKWTEEAYRSYLGYSSELRTI